MAVRGGHEGSDVSDESVSVWVCRCPSCKRVALVEEQPNVTGVSCPCGESYLISGNEMTEDEWRAYQEESGENESSVSFVSARVSGSGV